MEVNHLVEFWCERYIKVLWWSIFTLYHICIYKLLKKSNMKKLCAISFLIINFVSTKRTLYDKTCITFVVFVTLKLENSEFY